MQYVLNFFTFVAIGIILVVIYSALRTMQPPATSSYARSRPPNTSVNQVKVDPRAGFINDRSGFLFRRRFFFVGTGCPPTRIEQQAIDGMSACRHQTPQHIVVTTRRNWWWFEDSFYRATPQYARDDILALVRDRQRRERAKLERAHTRLQVEQSGPARGNTRRRPSIPRELKRAVFERDGGRCNECRTNFDIQYDHTNPFALGGATTFENA